jgi:hypothetical protein
LYHSAARSFSLVSFGSMAGHPTPDARGVPPAVRTGRRSRCVPPLAKSRPTFIRFVGQRSSPREHRCHISRRVPRMGSRHRGRRAGRRRGQERAGGRAVAPSPSRDRGQQDWSCDFGSLAGAGARVAVRGPWRAPLSARRQPAFGACPSRSSSPRRERRNARPSAAHSSPRRDAARNTRT